MTTHQLKRVNLRIYLKVKVKYLQEEKVILYTALEYEKKTS